VTLLKAAPVINGLKLEGDQKLGAEILRRALEEPLRQLVRNAGLEGSVVVEELRKQDKANWGFDVLGEKYVELLDEGIAAVSLFNDLQAVYGPMALTE